MQVSDIYDRLKQVIDPELHVNIVDLGLIYEVTISDKSPKIHILSTLTTPACPLAGTIHLMIRQALSDLPDIDVDTEIDIELTFDPPWTQDMMSEELKAEFGVDEW